MEAINNGVEHGSLPVQIRFELTDNEVVIIIKDNGTGFEVLNKITLIKQKGAVPLLEGKICKTRGRGIYLMYLTAKEVQFNEQGNEVR